MVVEVDFRQVFKPSVFRRTFCRANCNVTLLVILHDYLPHFTTVLLVDPIFLHSGDGERRLNASLLKSLHQQDEPRLATGALGVGQAQGLGGPLQLEQAQGSAGAGLQQHLQAASAGLPSNYSLPGGLTGVQQAQLQMHARGLRPGEGMGAAAMRPNIPALMPAFAAQMGVATQQAPMQQGGLGQLANAQQVSSMLLPCPS